MADDPPYLTVGTEVSAKYKGAFCEAKIRKVVRVVKCKVTFKAGNGSGLLTDDHIKGTLRIGANVEAKHPDKNQFLEATINKIQDCSQYTVVFDDGDITTLRRSALCLKSGRHFNESETLDQLPLTHPEHFSNPVVGGRRGVRRRIPNTDAEKEDSSEEEDEDIPAKKDGRRKYDKELDMGKVVCVESTDKKKSKDTWFPALVVSPAAQETVKIRIKDEYLVRSFRDGRYYTVPKKEISEFTRESSTKYETNSNVLRTAVDKALQYLEKHELPPHWDREVLFGSVRQTESGRDEEQSESEVSEDDPREEKDRFIAQLYKFMDDRSTPLNKVPQVCSKDLDLHKLFKVVTSKGGYTKVTNQSQWKAITLKMGFGNMPSTSTINLVKQAYKKFLFNFEEFYRKLGCTWTPRSVPTSSKSRSSRSIFRERITPSSSRESVRESREREKKEEASEESSSSTSKKDAKEKEKEKEKEDKEKDKDKSSSSIEVESPEQEVVVSEPEAKKPEQEEPRRSRGRQKKEKEVEVEEPTSSPSTATKKKRQLNASKERDSSVASSKEDGGPPTPSSSTASTPTTTKKVGVGRGKYKRNSTKTSATSETEEKEVKEEKPVVPPPVAEPSIPKSIAVRLGDKLSVYYPKSEGKTYEAKVIDINDKNESFLVHYTGWNNRYDEWIDRSRVSQNITLKIESGDTDGGKNGGKGTGKRKGRNSSSATSTTSSNAAAPTPPPATPTSSTSSGTRSKSATGKRKRSTSSEIQVLMNTTPKRRRTRQKSGQESTTAAQASESEAETSDSDVKSIKSEKNTGGPPGSRLAGRDMVTPTPESDAVSTKEQKSTVSTKAESKKDKKEKRLVDDDEGMSSSSESTKSKDVKEVPPVQIISTSKVEDTKESSSSSTSCSQVIDLNQIRSEMKGLNKMVKSAPGTATATPASSPVPPSLAAVGISPSEATKVDIYEFQEDANDDTATSTAPKLKMFSPRSPDKGPTAAPEVSPKKEETPATDPIPEKAEKVVKVEVGACDVEKPPIAASVAAPTETPKDTTVKVTLEKAVPPAQPKTTVFSSGGTPTTLPASMSPYVALNSSSVPASLLTSVASSSTTVASVLVTTTPSVMSATVAPSLVAVASTAVTTVSKTKPILGMTQRVPTPLTSNVPLRATPASVVSILPVTSGSSPTSHPPPPPLVPSGAPTVSLVTAASSAPISAAVVIPAHSVNLGSPPPPVLIQRPSIQPVLTPLRPLLTISSSTPGPTGTILERPLLQPVMTGHTVPLMTTSTVSAAAKDAAKLLPFVTSTTRRQDMFPHLVHSLDATTGSKIPTISIISAKEAIGSDQPPTQTQVQQLQHPFPPVTAPAPIKIAATIPPPPPVLKPVVKSTTSYGPIGIEATPGVKQKKKKSRTLSSSPASSATTLTPVKSMAPLPSGGAPPPPPVVVSTVSSGTTSMMTPTPGRKTPVKKRIPPPMESPGKPMKNIGTPLKPGKMNPEAMNAAIANVGASPPVVVSVSTAPIPATAVPTTVITSTGNLFQTASFNSPSVLFATTTTSQQPQLAQKITPPPPPVTIKSSAESIAASIAAVASMGSTSKSPLISVKSGMPTKRFMKDSPSKDKLFPGSVSVMPQQMQFQQAPPHLQLPGGPPQPFMIGKAMDSCQHQQQQQQHQTQAPITIQAKFQTGVPHTISASPISGPAVTFVKTTGHHILEQGHVQSNLPKHPVIIIPAAPVVIKPAPFQHHPTPQPIHPSMLHPQHHHHHTMQPVIVSKSLQMDGMSLSQPSVLVTAAPSSSVVKSGTMLPITVTPSIMHSTPIVSVTMHQQGISTPVIDMKPSMVDLPPTITVTKATTVMKSISPDIVAVSSYNSSSKSGTSMGFSQFKQDLNVPAVQLTRLEPEPRKEPEIVLKPAPPSAQIVFQTESKRGDVVQVGQSSSSTKLGSEQGALRGVATATATSSADESCNSLLCEEIIPGSPTTGEESEKIEEDMGSDSKKVDKSEDEEDAMSEPRLPTQGSSSKPVIVLGPKYDDDEDGFMLDLIDHRRSRFGDDDDDKLDDRSVDSPMGPPSEGRMDLPFRDSFSDGDGGDHDHSPPSSPSTTSSISTDDSSHHRDISRLSPTPGGSSKSKDSDEDDMDSDVGSKSTHIDDGDSKHGSTRGSRRIRNQSSRLGRSPSPPMNKRRRTMRRNKSPEEEMSRYTQRSRTSSGRKLTPVGGMSETKEVKVTPPVPPVNLAKPPKTGRYNFIPNLNEITDPDQRISMISQAIYDLKDQYHKTKTEAASFDRRVKRWKRRVREKERLARQEATRAAS